MQPVALKDLGQLTANGAIFSPAALMRNAPIAADSAVVMKVPLSERDPVEPIDSCAHYSAPTERIQQDASP